MRRIDWGQGMERRGALALKEKIHFDIYKQFKDMNIQPIKEVMTEVNCFRCKVQMEYVLPETIDEKFTHLLCPSCPIKYLVPNTYLKEKNIALKALTKEFYENL